MIDCRVIILCGGRGRRLKPHTEFLPKPMLEVSGKPMLEHILLLLESRGFKRFTLATGYLSEVISDYAKNRVWAADTEYEISDAGTDAGLLARICEASRGESGEFLVLYGDTFVDVDFKPWFEHHRRFSSGITLLSGKVTSPFGILNRDEVSGGVASFVEKPTYDYYLGAMLWDSEVLSEVESRWARMPDGEGLVSFFQHLIQKKRLGSYVHNGLRMTFNTESERSQVSEQIADYYTIRES